MTVPGVGSTDIEPETIEVREREAAPACIPVTDSKRLPCDLCGHPMEPGHAHYTCPACACILPCCGW